MALPRRNYSRTAITLILIFSAIFLPSISVGSKFISGTRERLMKRMEKLGSRPPNCVKRCLDCSPCLPALVIPPHPKTSDSDSTTSLSQGDESYYLLHWRCKCGDHIFQP